jgi:hypothetical protein
MWSEMGYYWDAAELETIVIKAISLMSDGGHFVAVHWLGYSRDHLLNGLDVHRIIGQQLGLSVVQHREPSFVLEIWAKT